MVRRTFGVIVLALGTLAGFACGTQPPKADLVLLDGAIVTMDEGLPRAEALAALDGRILAVGDSDSIKDHIGPHTRVIDLDGRLAVPGFIESHAHFTGIGRALMNIDLRDASDWDDVVGRVATVARDADPGAWVLGWGWHQDKWERPPDPAVDGYPTHQELSAAIPDRPVLLKHAAGSHAGMINAEAMRRAGIDASTADPDGGTILRDAGGEPTGVLRESAYEMALAAMERDLARRPPEAIKNEGRREIELADRECLSKGLTTVHDAGSDFETVARLRRMAEAGDVGVRLWVMLRDDIAKLERLAAESRVVGERFSVRAIKSEIDGALGTHGAWLLEPYADLPKASGLNTLPLETLERTARLAADLDMQLCVHAIGDRGNRETLDLFERTFETRGGGDGRRWRIEHAQHLHPDDVGRFARLGVIASMQGVHCTSDAPWVPSRLGERRSNEGAYRWRDLIDAGVVVVNGTDAPIEDVDPIANFYASVTRRPDDAEPFVPEQRMTRLEALRSYTIDAARAGFEEETKGSLTPGKLADVTVLSDDILTVPEDDIRDAEVVYTIVGGRVLYEHSPPPRGDRS